MEMITTFMGREPSYWLELEKRVNNVDGFSMRTHDLLAEIAKLRGKVSFYENRIEEMVSTFRSSV